MRQPRLSASASNGAGSPGIDHRRLATGRVMDQPEVIVGEGRDGDDIERRHYQLPLLGIDDQGSAGSR